MPWANGSNVVIRHGGVLGQFDELVRTSAFADLRGSNSVPVAQFDSTTWRSSNSTVNAYR